MSPKAAIGLVLCHLLHISIVFDPLISINLVKWQRRMIGEQMKCMVKTQHTHKTRRKSNMICRAFIIFKENDSDDDRSLFEMHACTRWIENVNLILACIFSVALYSRKNELITADVFLSCTSWTKASNNRQLKTTEIGWIWIMIVLPIYSTYFNPSENKNWNAQKNVISFSVYLFLFLYFSFRTPFHFRECPCIFFSSTSIIHPDKYHPQIESFCYFDENYKIENKKIILPFSLLLSSQVMCKCMYVSVKTDETDNIAHWTVLRFGCFYVSLFHLLLVPFAVVIVIAPMLRA